MKNVLTIALALMMATGLSACNPNDPSPAAGVTGPAGGNGGRDGGDDPGTDPAPDGRSMVIRIGSVSFSATLAENSTAKAFRELLPLTVEMRDLNRNEKYCDLSENLPSAPTNPGTIRSGDIMLFGSRTIVLFYKTFSTSYGYTRIGALDDPAGLETALGAGSVSVTFEIDE